MSWAKLDDGIYDHPKVLNTSLEALGLYLLALAYAARHLTDGRLSGPAITMLSRGDTSLAPILVAQGLWEGPNEVGGYLIHDYLDWNLSANDAKLLQKAARERMKSFRMRSREQTPNERRTNTFVPDKATAKTPLAEHRVKISRQQQDPTTQKTTTAGEKSTTRATRLPVDAVLSDEGRAYAVKQGCRQPERLFTDFRDYWRGNGKPMVDWGATFQRWARSAHDGTSRPCGCAPKSTNGKPSVRDMARNIAAKWAEGDR